MFCNSLIHVWRWCSICKNLKEKKNQHIQFWEVSNDQCLKKKKKWFMHKINFDLWYFYFQKSKARDEMIELDTHMPARQLKIITFSLVVGSMIIAILIPNGEFWVVTNITFQKTETVYVLAYICHSKAQFLRFCSFIVVASTHSLNVNYHF